VMVFAGAHISGAHYNPAVSIAGLLAGKLRHRQAACYILTQLSAGVLAALLVGAMVGPATRLVVASDWKILVGEFVFTLALAYVVLNVTAATATEGNSFFGLAIGATIATGILAVGKTSGGLFNLSAALGGGVTGALAWISGGSTCSPACLGALPRRSSSPTSIRHPRKVGRPPGATCVAQPNPMNNEGRSYTPSGCYGPRVFGLASVFVERRPADRRYLRVVVAEARRLNHQRRLSGLKPYRSTRALA
jgi:hypothetical protein